MTYEQQGRIVGCGIQLLLRLGQRMPLQIDWQTVVSEDADNFEPAINKFESGAGRSLVTWSSTGDPARGIPPR